jgi:hypothetical protein
LYEPLVLRRAIAMATISLVSTLTACGGGDSSQPVAAAPSVGSAESSRSMQALAWRKPAATSEMLPTVTFDAGEHLVPTADGQFEALAGIPAAPVGASPGSMSVQYQGGDLSQREALILDDPLIPGNQILGFFLREANVDTGDGEADRGRVQLNAYDATQLHARELRVRTRMYLRSDVDLLRGMSKAFEWLTISEWWNNASWTGEPFPFRVSVNIVKPLPRRGSQLNFKARAQTLDTATQQWSRTVWQVTNRSVPVPVGKWVTLEYSYLEGNASSGRFYLLMTPDGGRPVVLFDIRSWTHHPDDPSPNGLSQINPVKLYTSRDLIEYVSGRGGVLSVYWDDLAFRLCAERGPENSSPCAPASFQ